MNRIKRWLRKSLRRWLGISSNLDLLMGLIIIDGRARIEALEKHKKDIHYTIDEQMIVTLKANNKSCIDRFEAIEKRVNKLEHINISCGIDNSENVDADYIESTEYLIENLFNTLNEVGLIACEVDSLINPRCEEGDAEIKIINARKGLEEIKTLIKNNKGSK